MDFVGVVHEILVAGRAWVDDFLFNQLEDVLYLVLGSEDLVPLVDISWQAYLVCGLVPDQKLVSVIDPLVLFNGLFPEVCGDLNLLQLVRKAGVKDLP